MSRIVEDNKSNTHLIVDGITVRSIQNGQIKEISDNVSALKDAHSTLAKETRDYWSELAADSNITPEEKKILYKEWLLIQDEYIAILKDAEALGIPASIQELINYKKEYEFLYNLLNVQLKLFDSMETITKLLDRETFIVKYNNYYAARDALRNYIVNVQISDAEDNLQGQVDKVVEDLQHITQGGVADGSITVDKLSSGLRDSITQFESAAATGFLTDDILKAIDTADAVVSEELKGIISNNEKNAKLYYEAMADRFTTIIDDKTRKTRSRLTQATDEFKVEIVDMAKETATQFKITSEAITQMATDLRKETSAAVKVEADRITNMVTAGNTDAYLSLSVGIPYFLTVSKYNEWNTLLANDAEGKEVLSSIYELKNTGTTENPSYLYVIGNDVSKLLVSKLTAKLRALNALSSQVVIDAEMVQVKGTSIFSSDNKILQSYVDYTGYATDAKLGEVEQIATNAEGKATNATTTTNNFINAVLKDPSKWDGTTIIDGGFIKTDLIDADAIITKIFQADEIILTSSMKSANYTGSSGFYFDGKTGNVNINNGIIRGVVYANDGEFTGVIKARNVIRWYEDGDKTLFEVKPQNYFFTSQGEGTVGLEVTGNVYAEFYNDQPYASMNCSAEYTLTIYKLTSGPAETIYTSSGSGSIKVGPHDYGTIDMPLRYDRIRNIQVSQGTILKGKLSISAPGSRRTGMTGESKIKQKYVNSFLQGV